MTTAQQQHCLISNVFLNLGCQGSLVGGCLLYFFYPKKKKKSVFFPPQTMTNPKTKEEEEALPAIVVKAAVSLLKSPMVLAQLLPAANLLEEISGFYGPGSLLTELFAVEEWVRLNHTDSDMCSSVGTDP